MCGYVVVVCVGSVCVDMPPALIHLPWAMNMSYHMGVNSTLCNAVQFTEVRKSRGVHLTLGLYLSLVYILLGVYVLLGVYILIGVFIFWFLLLVYILLGVYILLWVYILV